MQLKHIILFLAVSFFSFAASPQNFADKIDNVLNNESAETRGKLTEENGVYTLYYFDVYEKDSHAKSLQERGFHGGGPTWLAMLYSAFNIYEENVFNIVKYGVDVSGITVKSRHKEDLVMISKVIALIKSDQAVMDELIEEAKKLEIMK